MNRFVDKGYYAYTEHSCKKNGIMVKCPQCHGLGIVTVADGSACFRCTSCGQQESKESTVYRYAVHNQCEHCGRYYRTDIDDEKKQQFPVLRVACPYCGTMMAGKVQKTSTGRWNPVAVENGTEPWFGLELWFLTSCQGKLIWAFNREHLAYLIDYLSAELREKPVGLSGTKTQADHLPTFMKTAKNRERIVKRLKELQART